MCNYWSLWALSPWYLGAAWVGGWATGWQQGLARNANWLSQTPMPTIRTPLLRRHVETLKLNPHAGQSAPYRMRGEPLQLVPRD
ncbi:hypothetical protein [Aromatoleum anaerobium]|uniref:Uncharacterized protein n=1 Tax=Aromatoleum anaerobium TaxID=182180 RepID=A0ABX1PS72_9RHOO|nr:hypothetical protein [Aromatoleum anaerobium]MCK0507900.1 hypothetical protein [Aromatoleum anaerobium]